MVNCLSWLRCLWADPISPKDAVIEEEKFDISSLPDDITVDILSRLSIETLMTCREVCWRWHSLTSTSEFSEVHSRRVGASPVLLLQYEKPWESLGSTKQRDEHPVFYIEDYGMKPSEVEVKEVCTGDYKRGGNSPEFIASCNGFLLLRLHNMSTFVICNPMTLEGGLTLTWPNHMSVSIIGFFFDESTKEYMLLHSQRSKGFLGTHYTLYNLNTRESNPLGKSRYSPDVWDLRPAVYTGGASFFMVEHQFRDGKRHPHCSKSIMMVNVKERDDQDWFTLFPHPPKRCGVMSWKEKHANMRLSLESDGQLLFSAMYAKAVHIWVLHNTENWSWVKTFVVDFERFQFRSFLCFGDSMYDYEPHFLGIQNRELVLYWPHQGLFLYNLQQKTVRKIRGSLLPKDSAVTSICALSCTKSLASLTNLGASSKTSRHRGSMGVRQVIW